MTNALDAGYELRRRLAVGGMAQVHLAARRADGRLVVVKRPLPHLQHDAGIRARFDEERALSRRLRHPNVVEVVEVLDDPPALVLAYVDGPSLEDVLRRGPLPAPLAARVGVELLSALGYVHSLPADDGTTTRCAHRDVTPSNVLFDAAGDLKLIDFGVALVEGRRTLTAQGALVGKIGHVAPEIVEGERGGPASDLFSLGVVLYEATTGRHPFDAKKPDDVMRLVLAARPAPPSTIAPALPAAFDAWIARALARVPQDRFVSAWAASRALHDALPPASPEDLRAAVRPAAAAGVVDDDPATLEM